MAERDHILSLHNRYHYQGHSEEIKREKSQREALYASDEACSGWRCMLFLGGHGGSEQGTSGLINDKSLAATGHAGFSLSKTLDASRPQTLKLVTRDIRDSEYVARKKMTETGVEPAIS